MNAVAQQMRQHRDQMTSITAHFLCGSLVTTQEMKRKHTQSLEGNMGTLDTLPL